MATVVIDAGHGGSDPGAVNGNRFEKDDVLRMSFAVRNILRNCGVNVVMTRSSDTFIPLNDRSRISNNLSPAPRLFVSIHRNGSTNPAFNGLEAFVHTSRPQASVNAANTILNSMTQVNAIANRGLQTGNFSVLRETREPSVLLELGFISNNRDNQLFDENFCEYARAIADGIMRSIGVTCGNPLPPTPPTSPVPTPTDVIRNIQQTLNIRYGAGLNEDGTWGPLTNRALIRAYQTELNREFNAGLNEDGIWGPKTRASTRILRNGDRGNLVWVLQAALTRRGFQTGSLTGVFGPITEVAVRSFQQSVGLNADGLAGPNTFEALFRL